MKLDYDVIVVGAGPGGSTAARLCAEVGLKTVLVEKERLPRYKACGGCLSAKAVHLLDLDLTPVIERTISEAEFTYCSRDAFFIHAQMPFAYMVMRDRFDHFLVGKATERGVEILEGEKVARLAQRDEAIEVELTKGERFRCQFLIGADGAGSVVARSFALLPPKDNGGGTAVESEIALLAAPDLPEEDLRRIHLDFGLIPNGYGWVFPKKEGLSIGIGGMFQPGRKMNPRRYFDTFLKGLCYIDEKKVSRIIGHPLPAFYDERQKVSRGNVLLVGDACHLMDPLMGEGIYYAIRSGMLAAKAIAESKEKGVSPSDSYQTAVELLIFENLKWALYFSRFVFRFTRLAYRTLQHYPELGNLYLQVLEGSNSYQGFVTQVKKRMKDLLKGRLSEKIRRAMLHA